MPQRSAAFNQSLIHQADQPDEESDCRDMLWCSKFLVSAARRVNEPTVASCLSSIVGVQHVSGSHANSQVGTASLRAKID